MLNGKKDFRKAFADAKKSGAKTFTYEGKKYRTQTAEEKAKTMSPNQKLDAYYKAYSKEQDHFIKTGKLSKSKSEVTRSYQNAVVSDPKALSIDYDSRHGQRNAAYSKKTK